MYLLNLLLLLILRSYWNLNTSINVNHIIGSMVDGGTQAGHRIISLFKKKDQQQQQFLPFCIIFRINSYFVIVVVFLQIIFLIYLLRSISPTDMQIYIFSMTDTETII